MNWEDGVYRPLIVVLIAIFMAMLEIGCGGAASTTQSQADPPPSTPPPPPAPAPTYDDVPHYAHVALVVFENQEEDKIFGNPNMPWMTNLAMQNAYAANYFADTHPSLGNYFMLTTGQIITNDLNFGGVVDVDNIVREVIAANKTWKAYEESIPSVGYLADMAVPYEKTHDPAAYLSDVRNNPAQAANLVPLTQLPADMAAGTLPDFMFIEPNQINTMHDCPSNLPNCDNDQKLMVGDNWAQQNLGPLLSNPEFQQNGLLIITWDESWDVDSQHGGGHVLLILAGSSLKPRTFPIPCISTNPRYG